jgi:hypothetical protein
VWRVPEPSRATVFRAFGGSSGGGGGGSGSGKTPQWNLQLQQALGKLLPGGVGRRHAHAPASPASPQEALRLLGLWAFLRGIAPHSNPFTPLQPHAGGARQAPPAVMLLHLGLYTVMAAGLWVVMRLQHEGGPSALPWG